MHELSLCGAIADIATRRSQDRAVEVVHVQIGQLRQVVPDTLVFCWSMVTSDTPLDGSVLEVERTPARLRCDGCGDEHEMGSNVAMACRRCGGTDVAVVAGDEFVVIALELGKV